MKYQLQTCEQINGQGNIQKKSDYIQEKMDPQDTSTDDYSTTSMIDSRQISKADKHSSLFSKGTRKSSMRDSFSYNNNSNTQSMRDFDQVNGLSSHIMQMMQKKRDKTQKLKQVFILQQYLQKQYLMLVKQQSQKSKFIKEIQDQMKNYYALLIQTKERNYNRKEDTIKQDVLRKGFELSNTKKPMNKIVTDDGFDNCSNFIKQIIIHTSRHYEVATILLMNCTISQDENEKGSIFIKDYLSLVDLLVNVLYQRVSETDHFLKEITKLVCELLARLPKLRDEEQERQDMQDKYGIRTNCDKVLRVFNTYMQKQQIQDYFEILSNNILKKIEKISFHRAQHRSRVGISLYQSKSILTQNSLDMLQKQFTDPTSSFGCNFHDDNWMQYVKPHESFNEQKRALAMGFLSQVYSQADLCPIGLKIVLKYFYQKQHHYYESKYPQKTRHQIKQLTSLRLWQLIQQQYINKLQYETNKQNILFKQMSTLELQIVAQIKNIIMGFFNCKHTVMKKGLSDEELVAGYRKSRKFIMRVVEKLLSFNEEKYGRFVEVMREKQISRVVGELSMKKVKSEFVVKRDKHDSGWSSTDIGNERKNSMGQSQTVNADSIMGYCVSMIGESSKNNVIKKTKEQKQVILPGQLLRIYGGCISFKQLQILLQSLRRLLSNIPNQRIINRVQRIFDMSPQLQFLTKHKLVKHPNQIQFLYIILLENQFDDLISNDYRVVYNKEYEGDKVKSMIRQIICELKLRELSKRVNKRDIVNKKKVNKLQFQLDDLKTFKKNNAKYSPQKGKQKPNQQNRLLINLLQKISDECSKSVQGTQIQYSLHKGISLQLLKKIKYLLYMFKNKSSQLDEPQILAQMLDQVKDRSEKMRRIYQHTKFGLLAAIGNIKHYKNLLVSRKEIQLKIQSRVSKIQLLEKVHLNLCITSPYTRSHPELGLKHEHSIAYDIQRGSFSPSKSPQKQQNSPSKQIYNSFTKQKQALLQKFQEIKNPKQSVVFFQPFNKYKYRISNADDIVICSTEDCIHKDNIFMGLSYHLISIQQFIQMFSALREVMENMFFAGFVIPQQLALETETEKKLHDKLKSFAPVKHPLAVVFMNKKYGKLHYSIDKINATFYEFIDYIMEDKVRDLSQQLMENKHELAETRKVLKDILLRGIHSKLVKKIENRIKVNLLENKKSHKTMKQQSNKIKCLINHGLDMPISLPNILTNFIDDDDDNAVIEEEEIVKDVKESRGSASEEIRVADEGEVKSSLMMRLREVPSRSRVRKLEQNNGLNSNNSDQKQLKSDSSIIQSRNDQILLYQIQRIHNSKRFQSFNHHQYSNNNKIDQADTTDENTISMKQLQQVCARYIKGINKKQTPEDKIELLKQLSQLYKLVVRQPSSLSYHHKHNINDKQINKPSHNTNIINNQSQPQQHYTLQKLIFRSLIIAQPQNLITNLAFIQIFLHRDKMLANQGRVLNQFKTIVKQIFQYRDIEEYLGPMIGDENDVQQNQFIERVKNISYRQIHSP